MILADQHIRDMALYQGLISPYLAENQQPASYDVTLGDDPIVRWIVGPGTGEGVQVEQDLPYLLWPGEPVVLGITREYFRIPPNLLGLLSGKSTLARLGISVHETAGFIDPGFEGRIVLELSNNSPVPFLLEAGMKIGQVSFWEVKGDVEKPYGLAGNHYQGQNEVLVANREGLN